MKTKSTSPARIFFLSASPGVWGAEESLLTLAKALKQNGQEVALVCFSGPLADRWTSDLGILPLVAGNRADPDSTKLTSALTIWRAYLHSAAKGDAAVLFTYYLVALAPIARLFLLGRKVTLVLDMHDNLQGPKGRALLQLCATFIPKIVAVSSFTASQFGPHASRVKVITRPVEEAHQAETKESPSMTHTDTVRIGIVGRLVRDKGHELLLNAASRLSGNFEVVVRGAGDGSPEDVEGEVQARGRNLLGDQFVFEGSVPRTRAMDGLDILVVANDREPLGRTVIEAQLNGVVAVVPNAGGSTELVIDGVTGCKYSARNEESLAKVLSSLIVDADGRKAIATKAKREAILTSSPSAYARSYLTAIRRA